MSLPARWCNLAHESRHDGIPLLDGGLGELELCHEVLGEHSVSGFGAVQRNAGLESA